MYLLKGIQKSFDFQNNQEKKKNKKNVAANDLQFNGQMTLIQGGCFYTHISFMISFYFLLTMSIFNRKQF